MAKHKHESEVKDEHDTDVTGGLDSMESVAEAADLNGAELDFQELEAEEAEEEAEEETEAEKAEEAAYLAKQATELKQAATKAKGKLKVQEEKRAPVEIARTLCLDGCGQYVTAGSRFLPGHDAKLKSKLLKIERGEMTIETSGLPEYVISQLSRCTCCGQPMLAHETGMGPVCRTGQCTCKTRTSLREAAAEAKQQKAEEREEARQLKITQAKEAEEAKIKIAEAPIPDSPLHHFSS